MASNISASPDQIGHKGTQGGSPDVLRSTLYQELLVKTVDQLAFAQAGQLWVATNPTTGTGIASHAAPTATDGTKPLFTLKNNYALGTDKHIYLLSLLVTVTVAGANATSSRYELYKSAAGVSRFTSGGSSNVGATTVNVANCGTAQGSTSAQVRFGAVVAPADTNAVLLANGTIRSIIPKVNDKILFRCGSSQPSISSTSLEVTTAAMTNEDWSAMDLAPQETLCLHLINAAQDAASSYEFRAVFAER